MKKVKGIHINIKKLLIQMSAALLLIQAGCTAGVSSNSLPNTLELHLAARPDQFSVIIKDGVQIACPKFWQTYSSDPSLIYGVSLADTIRIVIGVLPAASLSYYDGLVSQGTVYRTFIAGYPAYRNDYTYMWNGYQLTSICVSAVQGSKVCHFMFLCDTSEMDTYWPIFEYVLNSLKFL